LQDLEFRNLVERVKLRAPIEGIVAQRVSELRQKGALYWACCPFHEERTPSFAVDPRRGTWRCYGACGEGGDVLSFIQRFDGLSFMDSLRMVAREVGEELDEKALQSPGTQAKRDRRDQAFELLGWAAAFYRDALGGPGGAAARDYVKRRGFSDEVCSSFGLGWAQEKGSPLLEAAQRAKRPVAWLVKLGLVREDTTSGRAYDFFRGRLLIPIRDRLGRVVGFGGRLLEERTGSDGRPIAKYVNTPETPLFRKGRIIFGLDLAMETVRKQKELHLVEGYTDVMAAHQAGFGTTCAVLGTSTTEDHAALVRRSGVNLVTLVFDGDNAGRSAAHKALRGLLPLGVNIRIAELPPGCDPGDLLVSEEGIVEYRRRIEGARDWFSAFLDGLSLLEGHQRAQAVEEHFSLLASLKPIECATRLGELAEALEIPSADVQAQWKAFQDHRRRSEAHARLREPEPVGGDEATRAGGGSTGLDTVFGQLIGALLLDNSLIPLYASLEEGVPQGELAVIFRALLELHENPDENSPEENDPQIDAARVISALGAHPARDRVFSLQALAEQADSPENLARDQARWLERARDEAELTLLRNNLSQTVQSSGVDETAKDVLRSLHEKLRRGRVTSTPRSPSASAASTSL
jgi:DNA primase